MKNLIIGMVLIHFSMSLAADQSRPEYLPPVVNFEKNADGFFINKSNGFYLRYMWQSFVALSWPNVPGKRDVPDTNIKIPGSHAPLVWETYPQPQEVFLLSRHWNNYPSWDNIPDLPVGMSVENIKSLCHGFSAQNDIVLYDINQPNISIRTGPVAPLIDQYGRYVRYQVTMNRRYFEYISDNKYYNAKNQEDAVKISQKAQLKQSSETPKGAFKAIPFDQGNKPGMIETKAAWRILDPEMDDPSRYYVRSAFVLSPDKTQCEKAPIGAGLVALHIHRITRLSHVAATFEQVDNVDIIDPDTPKSIHPSFNPGTNNLTQQNIWPPYGNLGFQGNLPPVITAKNTLPPRTLRQANNISRATPIPQAVRDINEEFQHKYHSSVLRHYQLINVQHIKPECSMKLTGNFSDPQLWQPETCPQPNTNTLINAALESYTQLVNPFTMQPYNYSCRDCHSHARPCGFIGEITNKLNFKPEFMVMSYLLSKAKLPGQQVNVDGFSCNNPATQAVP